MVLRIEDTDPQRSAPGQEEAILEGLRWMGLDWDEGPDVGGPHAPYRQSRRRDLYLREARRLAEAGLVYPCYCTPEELEAKKQKALAEGRPPVYDGTCRELGRQEGERLRAKGRRPALRFRVPPGDIEFTDLLHGKMSFSSRALGDFILLRSDGTAGFDLSGVVDDAAMGITHVIRGDDHLTNTARHVLLYRALGYRVPVFAHHPLLLGPDGTKLSKRHGATSLREFREAGYLPEAVMNYLALLSWSPEGGKEVFSPVELVGEFRLEALSRSPAIFDLHKLDWLNGQHIRRADLNRLVELSAPFAPGAAGHPLFPFMVASVRDNLRVLSELPGLLDAYSSPAPLDAESVAFLTRSTSREALMRVREELEGRGGLDLEEARRLLAALTEDLKALGLKAGEILMPVRLALTGRRSGPPLPYVLFVLGKEECLRRLDNTLEQVG